jgi:hypothetical protein
VAGEPKDSTAEARITGEVDRRLRVTTVDQVADTRAKAAMERTLRREYHGRALIELLQNARDAWLADKRSRTTDGRVLVRLEPTPALVVANQGEPLSVERVLYSIAKFGASTKPAGTAIGHKGIGFKAVLELTECPEIYSRSAPKEPFAIQVRYDAAEALRRLRQESPDLDELDRQRSDDPSNPAGGAFCVPILEYPLWIAEPPSDIEALGDYDTVIRLPWSKTTTGVAAVRSPADWLEEIRHAIVGLSDAMVVLLGAFAEIRIEDDTGGGQPYAVRRHTLASGALRGPSPTTWEHVRVQRPSGSSDWLVFSRSVAGGVDEPAGNLAAEISVGLRIEESQPGSWMLAHPGAGGDISATSFHLFFPTRISSHLPFLLHGYFEVDAARKGFAEDDTDRNRRLLAALAGLVADVIADVATDHAPVAVDLSPLADLLAATDGEPPDALARAFRETVLDQLDRIPYVPVQGERSRASPAELLVDDRGRLRSLLSRAFDTGVLAGHHLHLPTESIGDDGYQFLTRRRRAKTGEDYGLATEQLATLLRAERATPGDAEEEDGRFVALLELCSAVLGAAQPGVDELLSGLHRDPSATVVPVIDSTTASGRRFRRAAWVAEQSPDAPILARANRSTGRAATELAPPRDLHLDFVADGLISADVEAAAHRLGIRPYLTDTALDGLARVAPDLPADDSAADVLRFFWQLLTRERQGRFSVRAAIDAVHQLEPGAFHWANPITRGDQPDQRRAQALSQLRLPSAAGPWAPAGTLAFGANWAHWFSATFPENSHASARAELYQAATRLAPGGVALLASPEELLTLLDQLEPLALGELDETRIEEMVFAFLLRIGVWEGVPIESHIDHRTRDAADRDPWPDAPGRFAHWDHIVSSGGLKFGVYAEHDVDAVRVAEDHRLSWNLESDPDATAVVLDRMAPLLAELSRLRLFCDRCHDHKQRYRSDAQPSFLTWQLQTQAWVPVRTGPLESRRRDAVRPSDAWYVPDPPREQQLHQSPLQFLQIADRAVTARVADLADIATVDGASTARITGELARLKTLSADEPHATTGTPGRRQAFIGAHNMLYRQLRPGDTAPVPEVLAFLGSSLRYVPLADARFDTGAFSAYRRAFDDVPFSTLPRHDGPTAHRLGLVDFDLELKLRSKDEGREIDVRAFVHDLMPEFFSLLVHHRLGGRETLELGSPDFVLRANRFAALTVKQLDDVVIEARLPDGTDDAVRLIGEDREDLFLDLASPGQPVLYTDVGANNVDRLRRLMGPHLAALVERPDFDAEFRLLLGFDDPGDRELFLEERGITPVHLDEVRHALEVAGLSGALYEHRWWNAMLPLLGVEGPVAADSPRSAARSAIAAAGRNEEWVDELVALGGSLAARRDIGPGSALALLDAHGVPLRDFHRDLQAAGDEGLALPRAADDMLNSWINRNHRVVAAALSHAPKPVGPEEAKQAPRHWRVAPDGIWHVPLPPSAVLADAVAAFNRAELRVDPEALVDRPAEHLAELLGCDRDGLRAMVEVIYSNQGDRAAAEAQALRQWRHELRPVLIAAATKPNDHDYEFRRVEADHGRRLAGTESLADLARRIGALPRLGAELQAALVELVRTASPFVSPDQSRFAELAALHDIEAEHLARVRRFLRRGPDQRISAIRRNLETVRREELHPRLIEVTPAPGAAGEPSRREDPKRVDPTKEVHRDPRRDKRIGDDAEQLVLATVIDSLPLDDQPSLSLALQQIEDLLRKYFTVADEFYEVKKALVEETLSQDEKLDALAQFLHLSSYSDNFACDMVGIVPVGAVLRPLLLEVKSTGGDSVMISAAEWRQAHASGEDYALMVVHRPRGKTQPHRLDLLVDPYNKFPAGSTHLATDTWILTIPG